MKIPLSCFVLEATSFQAFMMMLISMFVEVLFTNWFSRDLVSDDAKKVRLTSNLINLPIWGSNFRDNPNSLNL